MQERWGKSYRKIGVQLVVLVLVCSLLPLGVTTYIAESQAATALESESIDRQQSEVNGVAENAETRSDFYKRQIRVTKAHPAVRKLVKTRYFATTLGEQTDEYEKGAAYPALMGDSPAYKDALSFFDDVAEQNPNIDMIRVFWRDGNVLVGHKLGEEDTQDYKADKAWFERTMDPDAVGKNEVYVSSINVARATDSPAVRYAMPLRFNGERVGLIIINYKAKQITEPITSMDLGEEGYGMLVNPDYTNAEGENLGALYIANGRNSSLAFDESAAGSLAVDGDHLQGERGTFTYAEGDRKWHATYTAIDIGETRYYAVATLPVAQMMAVSRSIQQQSLLVALGAGLVVTVVGWFASRRYSRPIRRLAADAEAVAEGDLDHDIARSSVAVELENLTDAIRKMKGNVVEALDEAETQQELAEAQRREAEELTDHLERTVSEHETVMSRCADGDLTERMSTDSKSEAMNAIATSFNEMMADWEAIVGRVEEVASVVAASSEEADTGVAEVERAAGEVAESVAEISAGAAEQSENVNEVTGEMSQLSAAVEEVASTADEVAARSASAAQRGEEGAELADDAIVEMETIESKTEQTADVVSGLDDEVAEIGEIVELIDGIAEQTNTLALNASIEAARAGAEGEGFAVVADEVKELAAETREATGRIERLVDDVQASTSEAVGDIEETRARVDDGADTIEEALGALGDVVEAVEEANDGVQSISTAASDQAASAEEVVTMADEVATISEETAAEAQTVSAAAEEQSASLNEVSQEVERLAEHAEELERLTSAFDTDTDTDTNTETAHSAGSTRAAADASPPAATDGGSSE